jgi:hypothetical protein
MATQRTGQSATAELLDCYVKATRLIIEMFEDPERTYGSGPALLQCCYPVEMLRPLLRSQQVHLPASAMFVASELGRAAAPILDDAIALLASSTTRIQADAMDVFAVCATDDRLDRYVALVEQLDNPGESIRKHAAFLVGNGGAAQRDVARRYFEQLGRPEDANRWGAARQLP